jgi:glycosyltransferase involved in cell wall biosynthesis
VTFRGALPHAEALDMVSRAIVLCLPARMSADGDVDSMPLVIKEAMVRDVAVAGCDVGGVSEMIADGCGELVPPEDAAALADALHRLLADPEHRNQCALRARERALERFTLTGQVAHLLSLLDGLTEPHR